MSESAFSERDFGGASREEIMSVLFAQMVIQQTNMAMMLMGKTPHPQTGQTVRDLEAAQMFIDQLEMLQEKTKGNLGKEEEQILKSSLTSVRMAFVEAVHDQRRQSPTSATAQSSAAVSESAAPETAPAPAPVPSAASAPGTEAPATAAEEAESKKKFSKKY